MTFGIFALLSPTTSYSSSVDLREIMRTSGGGQRGRSELGALLALCQRRARRDRTRSDSISPCAYSSSRNDALMETRANGFQWERSASCAPDIRQAEAAP